MKSQNDIILAIVSIIIGVGCAIAFFVTKRDPITPAAPTTVTLTPVELPQAAPTMTNGLSGGNAGGGGGGFGGFGGGSFGGRIGGPPSMPGAPTGGSARGGRGPMGMGG